MKLEILTLDSKGRIVIPSKMLKVLSLSSEEKLVVYIAGDSIILKNKKYQTWINLIQQLVKLWSSLKKIILQKKI